MNIILATNEHPVSVAIREKTNSQYSHVAILDEESNQVIEANPKKGVCYTSLELFKKLYPIHEVREMPGDIEKAKALIGKPYDFEGLMGQALDITDVQDPNHYFCSEVVAVAAEAINEEFGHMIFPDTFKALSWPV